VKKQSGESGTGSRVEGSGNSSRQGSNTKSAGRPISKASRRNAKA
jgi:hypothetical protein